MASRRILYGAALTAALLFQITNENYLACFLTALCAVLPLLSLALSLPGMLRCRLILAARPDAADRGERGRWTVEADTPGGFPLARMSMRLTERNLLTGGTRRKRLKLTGVARRRPVELPASTSHCGLLELRVEKVRVCDYLGLFSIRRSPPPPARLLCRPIPARREPVDVPDGLGAVRSPRSAARRGPGEDYDLRDYRPGDPMRSVHWKLSSKWDKLIVREQADTALPLPLLTVDRFGTPEELDPLLDQLTGMSRALLGVQRPHAVLWLDGAGSPQLHPVTDEREYSVMLTALLTGPAPLSGPALDGSPELPLSPNGPVFRVHITREGGDGCHGG